MERSEKRKVGIIPGSFNPPTRAHVELARRGLQAVERMIWVIPQQFPHKNFDGASLVQRVEMLNAITAGEPRFDIEILESGLFIDMAREYRNRRGDADIWFVCGRDAAERIITWDYGTPRAIDSMFQEFGLLVAPRDGLYIPPAQLSTRIQALPLEGCDAVSSTEVRKRIRGGLEWRHLVPDEITSMVERIYS